MSVDSKMTAIADTIRSYTGKNGKLGLSDMPGAIDEAVAANGYDAGYGKGYEDGEASGYQNGYADGNDAGIADGKQAEYDRFWDAFQNYGNRKYYDFGFYYLSGSWNDESYRPKYDIICEGSEAFRQTFMGSLMTSTKVPIRCKNTRIVYTFQSCLNLKTIPLLVLEGITQINNAFKDCWALENITIEGEIPLSISFSDSTKLTKASIENIVSVLSSTASGQTLTLSKTAVTKAFGSTTAAEWTALVGTKSNWTISLV